MAAITVKMNLKGKKQAGVTSIEEIKAGKEFTLTLGRRYLEEEDIRSSWKANAEIRECLKIFSFHYRRIQI